jgi:hypothetical protein
VLTALSAAALGCMELRSKWKCLYEEERPAAQYTDSLELCTVSSF